jgi:hypothetical protein
MKKIKKIVFVGNFAVSYSSENDYLWTLREKLGIEVVTLQEQETTGEEIEALSLQADALFWVHTHGWKIPGKPMTDVLANLKASGIPTFGYHLDLWLGLERQVELEQEDYWKTEYFFTVDKLMADYMNARNDMPKAFFVRPGVVERDCVLAPFMVEPGLHEDGSLKEISRMFQFDTIFVGSYNYHPEWKYRPELIDWLHANYTNHFFQFGGDGLGVMRGMDLNRLFAASKVVIGDSLCINFDYPYYTSDRIYETTGRGGFMIHPYIEGLDEEFIDGEEVVFYKFGDFDDLKSKIDYYLTHDAERERIRVNGFKRTRDTHTYTQRLRQIFAILESEQ